MWHYKAENSKTNDNLLPENNENPMTIITALRYPSKNRQHRRGGKSAVLYEFDAQSSPLVDSHRAV